MKRLFDIVGSIILLIVLLPVLLVLGILVRQKMGSPVLFWQLRPGLKGKPYRMVKFRTMKDGYGADGRPLSDGERLTPFGQWLRKTSLDELPELWNVLQGDMSLVGPRPLLMEYLPLFTAEQNRRHDVKPGITGWAQVNGRNSISWEEKFILDVWYVDHCSLLLDIRILFITVFKVATGADISAAGYATMPRFKGSGRDSSKNTDS